MMIARRCHHVLEYVRNFFSAGFFGAADCFFVGILFMEKKMDLLVYRDYNRRGFACVGISYMEQQLCKRASHDFFDAANCSGYTRVIGHMAKNAEE